LCITGQLPLTQKEGNEKNIMGGQQSVFTNADMDRYETLTYLNRNEIEWCWRQFVALNGSRSLSVSAEQLRRIPVFKVNPFTERLVSLFGDPQTQMISFDQFVDLVSCLSFRADPLIKMQVAFRLFDCDGDSRISEDDLMHAIRLVTGDDLSEEELQYCAKKCLHESDLDGSHDLSFAEFQRVASRVPDFADKFTISFLE
jgi:Ca2+-binding EF-hand superfamily protein